MTGEPEHWKLGDLLDHDLVHAPKSLIALGHPAGRLPSAAERCAAMDGGPGDPSFNDLLEIIGPECDFRLPDVGGRTAAEWLNLALYWPALPPEYELEGRRADPS